MKCFMYSCWRNVIPGSYWCLEHAIESMKYNYALDALDAGKPYKWNLVGDDLKQKIAEYLKDHPEEALEI